MLRLDRVSKAFAANGGSVAVLEDVSLALDQQTTVAVTGESGSGKSTLLHIIAGLEAPDAGQIFLDDAPLTGLGEAAAAAVRREKLAIVFQQFNLVPSLTVADNLAFQARIAGRHDDVWMQTLTGRLGLAEMAGRYPEQLSGGQQQRVAIGRALAVRPRLLLADEPTGNLDQTTGDEVMDLMLDLVRESGAGLVMVTHSDRLAARLDRRLTLAGGKLT